MRTPAILDSSRRWLAREASGKGVLETGLGVAAFLAGAALLVGRLLSVDFSFDLWSDRDLIRATQALHAVPTHGAELSHGGGARIPGGMQYLLMAPVVAVSPEPEATWRWIAALDLLAAALLAGVVGRRFGVLAGGVAALAWAASEAQADTLWRVWNPAFLPLFAVAAWAAADGVVVGRRPWALPALVAALAIGAQLHLSTVLLVLPLMVAVACSRDALRPLPALAAAGVGLALYAPWLVAELWLATPQAASLAEQAEVRRVLALSPAEPDLGAPLWTVLRLLPRGVVGGVAVHPGISALASLPAVLGFAVIGVSAWRGAPGQRALARAALAALGVTGVYYLWDTHIDLEASGSARYVLPLLPVVAGAAGLGARALLSAGRARGRLAGAVAAATLLASGAAMVGVAASHRGSLPYLGDRMPLRRQLLDELRRETGWTLREVAGRTLLFYRDGDGWSWMSRDGIDHLLAIEGEAFPGSLPPPCAALFGPGADPSALTADALARWIGPDQRGVRVLRRSQVAHRHLVIFEPEVGPCRTSFIEPYVMTPVEEQLLALRDALQVDGPARRVGTGGDTRRFAFRLSSAVVPGEGRAAGVVAALDVEPSPGGPVFVLHSLQLRGSRFNAGWFGHGTLAEPTVLLTAPDREVRVPLGSGLVGRGGAATPLRIGPVPEAVGTWDARLEVTVVAAPAAAIHPVRTLDGEPRVIHLGTGLALE